MAREINNIWDMLRLSQYEIACVDQLHQSKAHYGSSPNWALDVDRRGLYTLFLT